MSNIKQALTRKIGPLPAWAWLSMFAVAVYYYRNKLSGGSAANTANTTTGQIQDQSGSGQSIVPLDPGQSAYDPNTGALVTAPGAGDTTGTGSGGSDEATAAIQALTDALTAAETPIPVGTDPTGGKNTAPGRKKKTGKTVGKGSQTHNPSGSNKRKAKSKAGAGATGKAGQTRSTTRPRSPVGAKLTGLRAATRTGATMSFGRKKLSKSGAAKGRSLDSGYGRARAVRTTPQTAARSRPTTRPVQRTNVTQRPAATHPAAKVPAHVAPKPTQRTRPVAKNVGRRKR